METHIKVMDASQVSKEIFEAWREQIMGSIVSGICEPKLFPIIPVYVATEQGIKRVESVEAYPEMNGVLINLVQIKEK